MRQYRLASIFIIFAFQFFLLAAKAQDITTDKVTLALKDESLETAIKAIEQQSAFRFFYHSDDVKAVVHLNLAPATRTIGQTLALLLQNTCLSFRQLDNHILLERKEPLTVCEIRGRIITEPTGQPVANASVFLSNATIGAVTAADGTFLLQNVKPGKYEVVVSHVGYDTYSQAVAADNKEVQVPPIVISSKTIMLTEVKVDSKADPDREKNYNLFKNEFLGSSPLAAACKILNPELLDINYNYSADILTASSEDFLEIENDALGYKIKYLLTNFIKTGNSNLNDVQFGGPALFREIKGSPAQQKRWQKNRAKAYEGSMMHFLRCLLNNSFEAEGFRVLRIDHLPNPDRPADTLIVSKIKFYRNRNHKSRADKDSLAYWQSKRLLPPTVDKLETTPLKQDDIVHLTNQKDLFALLGDKRSLYVVYSKSHHYPAKIRLDNLNESGNDNRTLVNFDVPYVLFDKNGCLLDPNCASFDGAWGKDRTANLLPIDYDPAWNAIEKQSQASTTRNTVTPPADQQALKPELIKLKNYSDSVAAAHSSEKPYLQLDRPWYLQGDTIWFKAYVVNAASLIASHRSGIMYVDIANDSDRIVKSYSFPLAEGLTWGNIGLDERTFHAGNYFIRAYTNWMRNFDGDFFIKPFYIAGATENTWLVSKQATASNGSAKIDLQFSDLSKAPVANIPINFQVFDGDKRLFKQTIQSDKDGAVDFNVPVPANRSNLKIIAQDNKGDKKLVVPVQLNRYINADIQFLPEGGALVAGLPGHVGVKAIGEDGKGIDVSGAVFDNMQNKVAEFKSLHDGMGSFSMFPESEGAYTAKVTLPDGSIKQISLPAVKSSGTILLVKNLPSSDLLDVSVGATNDLIRSGQKYYLVARARGVICYAAMIGFEESKFIRGGVAKNLFPTGMVHITLMSTDLRPVNERTVFVDRHDPINITLSSETLPDRFRDSISMKIKVTDNRGNPLKGNFSIAVTNDLKVDPKSLNKDDIISHLLLTSAVKGYIQEPGYYFSGENTDRDAALDNLLLTQGWEGDDWLQLLNPKPITYNAESGFRITGNVQTVFNRPLKGTHVMLFSKSPLILIDTVTDNHGEFIFDGLPRADTPLFLIKAVNKNGKSFNIGVSVNERTMPAFAASPGPEMLPWNINSDSTLINHISNNLFLQQISGVNATGQVLKEVKVTASKVIKASENLNGSGNADVVLDEKDMENAGKKNFLQLLEEHVKGFHESYVPKTSIQRYFINEKVVIFLVDGVILSSVFPTLSFTDLKDYLESNTAEDLKGIEVMHSSRYSWTYMARFYPMADPEMFAFVEITTRGGHGPVIGNTPGMYLYRPLAISWPKQFYKPKYLPGDTTANKLAAFGTTVDWEPNIVTDEKGEASVSFFLPGKPSSYTAIIEGTDMNGNFGYQKAKIVTGNPITQQIQNKATGK